MKKLLALTTVALLVFAGSAFAEGLILTVRPGTVVQSGQLGYRSGGFAGFLGLDFLSVSADATTGYEETYSMTVGGVTTDYRNVNELSAEGSARIAILDLGGRYYFGPTGPMQKYVFGSVFKSFPSVSAEGKTESWSYVDGTETSHSEDEFVLESEEEDAIKDALAFKGITIGLGGEYFFHPTFSVSGEYGLRWISFSTEYDKVEEDPDHFYDDYREEWTAEANAKLAMTYGVMALNYHFGETDE